MIFAVEGHIEKIIRGEKTQTRRVAKPNSFIYQVGKTYGVRKCRTCKNIPDGRILILHRFLETRNKKINETDANAEGGYSLEDYETLFEKMHKNWQIRYGYIFRFVPKGES